MKRLRPRLVAPLACAAVLGVGGVVLLHGPGHDAPARPAPAAAAAPHDALAARPSTSPREARLIGDPTGDVLLLPSLKVSAPLVSVAMDRNGTLTPPRDPRRVGYWSGSSAPGSSTGQTLVTGHTVHTGGGSMDRLGSLVPGARVVIRRPEADATKVVYRVSTVRTYSKAALARQAQELFGQDHGDGRLQLVTCTGWDGHDYSGNVVVTATPVGGTTA